jgi:hypothetical protein
LAESEVMILLLCAVLGAVGMGLTTTAGLHALHFRGNPAPGIVRVGVLLALLWIFYVLLRHADPSVTGVYVLFYLVMGYAAVKLCGQAMAGAYGLRTRVDVGERRNIAAAVVIAAFTLATGLIFGGSLWGEADPVGGDEGGWWIPVAFFLLGWGCLLIAFELFLRREKGRWVARIRRERRLADARAAATFLLAAGVALTEAVSGDFWGWRHGLLTFGVLAGLVLVHEVFATLARPERAGGVAGKSEARRDLESVAYALVGIVGWILYRFLDVAMRPG